MADLESSFKDSFSTIDILKPINEEFQSESDISSNHTYYENTGYIFKINLYRESKSFIISMTYN